MKDTLSKILSDLLSRHEQSADDGTVLVRIIEIVTPSGQVKHLSHAELKAAERIMPPTQKMEVRPPLAQFGTLEKAILSAATHDWKPAPVLAHDCSEEETTKFRITLANLVDRGILESSSRGYRLAPHIDLDELAKMI